MRVYLDHAATTAVDELVLKEMLPFFSQKYGNASSLHSFGKEAKEALEKARDKVAKALCASSQEIVFTGGGSESDNLAIVGFALANRGRGKHLITSSFEHPAVLNAFKYLKEIGFEVTFLPVSREGFVESSELERVLRKNTVLVSIMHANNEIGTIQRIKELASIAKRNGSFFHTDAVQTFGKIPIDVNELNVDLLSVSAHKIYGPKGVGALFVRKGIVLDPIIHGGGQEQGKRAGTENVAGIVGFGKAAELAVKRMEEDMKKQEILRNKLIKGVLEIRNSLLNGSLENRLSNNVNVSFDWIEGESLVIKLDLRGIAASTGSACSSRKLEPSHVLLSLGLTHEQAHGSLRMTLGRKNTVKEIDYVLKVLPEIVEELRKISPMAGLSFEERKRLLSSHHAH